MGYAGDVLGRRNAMLLTQGLSALGAIGSALFTWGSAETIYSVMGACRFLLGVGVGGKYPLTATMMREIERDEREPDTALPRERKEERARRLRRERADDDEDRRREANEGRASRPAEVPPPPAAVPPLSPARRNGT